MKTSTFTFILIILSLLEINAQISFEEEIPEYFHSNGTALWERDTPVAFDGNYSLKSGSFSNIGYSEINTKINLLSGGNVIFYKKMSATVSTDTLLFIIDDVVKAKWTGSFDWEPDSFAVSSGIHTFKWIYTKNNTKEGINDKEVNCAWIDYIIFPDYNLETSISEIDKKNNINIFPNPSSGNIFIKSEKNISSIILTDITGKRIKTINVNNVKQYSLNIKNKGIYILKIFFDDNKFSAIKTIVN